MQTKLEQIAKNEAHAADLEKAGDVVTSARLVLNDDEAVSLLADLDRFAPARRTHWLQKFMVGRDRATRLLGVITDEVSAEIEKRHGPAKAVEAEAQRVGAAALALGKRAEDSVAQAVELAKRAVSEAQRIGRAYDALSQAPAMAVPFRTTTAMRAAVPSASPAAAAELEALAEQTTDQATKAVLQKMAARALAATR